MVAIERAGSTARGDGVTILHDRPVVPSGQRQVGARGERQGIGHEEAAGRHGPIEVDARVVGLAVRVATRQAAIAEGADAGDFASARHARLVAPWWPVVR